MKTEKTIAAVSTAPAPGGIGVVRISGAKAHETADRVFKAKSGKPLTESRGYAAHFGGAYTLAGEKLDDVVALVFRSPHSYTGEDVVELSCHGGVYITRRLLEEVISAGAEPAQPGEFTRRAFLNGKLDLAQAEAVMELISAGSEQAAKAAEAGSSGALSKKIDALRAQLTTQAAHLAAWADFPEEDVPEVENEALTKGLKEVREGLERLLKTFDTGKIFREGIVTVIAGRPNAGKSTLMNLLAGCQRSIVTQYAGTTRDIVEETVLLGGVPLRLADTAGLRQTQDPVEQIGVAAARERLRTAQLVFAVFDASQPLEEEDLDLIEQLKDVPTVAVVNKKDLPLQLPMERIKAAFSHVAYISASQGEGLEELEREVTDLFNTKTFDPAAGVLFTQRQRGCALSAKDAVAEALQAIDMGLTLDAVTVCVEDALNSLYALTGERASEEIVDRVFEDFCVGK